MSIIFPLLTTGVNTGFKKFLVGTNLNSSSMSIFRSHSPDTVVGAKSACSKFERLYVSATKISLRTPLVLSTNCFNASIRFTNIP